MEQNESKYRLTFKISAQLMSIMVVADIIGLIPGAEWVIAPLGWLISYRILRKHGINILNGRKLATALIDIVIGFIPILQALPELTLGMALIILMVYAEDRTGLKLSNKKGVVNKEQFVSAVLNRGGVRQPNQQPQPLNQDGVREPAPQQTARVLGDHSRSEASNITRMEDIRPKEEHQRLDLAA